MSKVLVSEENLTNIANAIREKNGETTTYKPGDMATAIQEISGGAPKKGFIVNQWDDNGKALDVSIVGMTEIPDRYFQVDDAANCLHYTTIFRLPSNLTKIGSRAFMGRNSDLTSVDIPDSVTFIGEYCFYECRKLNYKKLPPALTSIEGYTFYNCFEMTFTELPNTITSIGKYAFYDCERIKITKIPDGVTTIGEQAFGYCKLIKTLELPKSLTSIGSMCFAKCTSLTTVTLPNVTEIPVLGTNAFGRSYYETPIYNGTGYIYVPDTLVDSFKSATNWSTYADQIKPISELEVA